MSEALHGHDSVDAAEAPSMGPRTASHGQVATGGRVGVVKAVREAHSTASQSVFDRDMQRFDTAFRNAGALVTIEDRGESFTYIDEGRAPQTLIRAYKRLVSYGYANGLMEGVTKA